ncbi:MAG TPA: hypothetical protein VF592_13740 [Sphingomonas sp.]|jgi:hypothetical protein|uniref:hypothetical protein n=1 Tax=Sphingomonas sp. TaxID=28214 RepID=UPI002ED97D10
MENPRTTSARDHDDHEIIDAAAADPTPGQGGTSGGNLQRDVASQSEEVAVSEPDALVRPQKEDDIHNNQAFRTGKPRDMTG